MLGLLIEAEDGGDVFLLNMCKLTEVRLAVPGLLNVDGQSNIAKLMCAFLQLLIHFGDRVKHNKNCDVCFFF